MLFFYVRHAEPIYNPDSLTEHGCKQAEALGVRMEAYAPDRIYASTSRRAIQTAEPTCRRLGKEMELLDFAHEGHAWNEFYITDEDGSHGTWMFQNQRGRALLQSEAVQQRGFDWYTHPAFAQTGAQRGVERVQRESDAFFASLGYRRIAGTGSYQVERANSEKIALFAHQGFGLIFLSCLLHIPYPMFALHFDLFHSGITAIEFRQKEGIATPCLWALSSDLHLERAGLPTKYDAFLKRK